MTSQRSAMTTIAVAQRATVTASCLLRSARGAWEEDDSIRGARNVLERPHHLGLTPTARVLDRDRRPHPLLELAPELLDEHLLVLADLDVALGDQLLAIPRAHAQELHARIMSRPPRQLIRHPSPDADTEHVHRAGPPPDGAMPVAHRLRRQPPRRPRGLLGAEAQREMRRDRARMRASGPMRGAVGIPLPCQKA